MPTAVHSSNIVPVPQEPIIRARCPGCKDFGVMEVLWHSTDIDVRTVAQQGAAVAVAGVGPQASVIMGQRRCPNPKCLTHIFFGFHGDRITHLYPPLKIPFDTSNLPPAIVESMEEAITCHAGECFKASAIMVRKTLEVLCDVQGAKGDNLRQRIDDLKSKLMLPSPLIDGLHELRLLGNDAAHVELKDFDQIGKTECDLALELTMEILKGVYQYDSMLSRFSALKASKGVSP